MDKLAQEYVYLSSKLTVVNHQGVERKSGDCERVRHGEEGIEVTHVEDLDKSELHSTGIVFREFGDGLELSRQEGDKHVGHHDVAEEREDYHYEGDRVSVQVLLEVWSDEDDGTEDELEES